MKQLLIYLTCLLWIWAPLLHSAPLSVFLSGGVGTGVTPPTIVTSNIAYVSAAGNNFGGLNPTVNYPSVLLNDIMIAIFASDSAHTTNTLPVGWTSLGTVTHTTGGTGGISVCWKRASSDDPASEVWTNFFTSSETGRVVVISYRNCISTGNPFDTITLGPSDEIFGTGTSLTSASTVINTMAVYIVGGDLQATSINWGAGITLRIDSTTTPSGSANVTTSIGALMVGEIALPTIGSVTMSGDFNSGASSHSKILLILKPNSAS